MRRALVFLSVLALGLGANFAAGSVPALGDVAVVADVAVVGDDDRDAFVGTGGLLLPASVDETTRREVAECPDCRWRLTSPCVDTELGNAFDGQASCRQSPGDCPVGRLKRSWFDDGGDRWRNLGLVCVRDRVQTVETMGRELWSVLDETLPTPQVGTLPAAGIVAQMPTYLTCGSSRGRMEVARRLGGHRVLLSARATWHWDFGDGASVTTSVPGTLVRGGPVRHVFRQAGQREVTCHVVWRGQFEVDGVGPFPVVEAVQQQARRVVPVGEGRALLTP
jgi:hypothetical protein